MPPSPTSPKDWSKFTVPVLKTELKKRGLPTTGVKAEIIARIDAFDAEGAKSQPPKASNPARKGTAAAAAHSTSAGPEDTPPESASPGATDSISLPSEALDQSLPATGNDGNALMSARDIQKRKRRSASPPPSLHETKRAKTGPVDAVTDDTDGLTREPASHTPATEETADENIANERPLPPADTTSKPETPDDEINKPQDEPIEEERLIPAAIHPATCALYIRNLMRPLHLEDVKSHLVELASLPGEKPDEELLTECYLDQVRTHALASFSSVAAAQRVRSALHDSVFPKESNRKALWVDFIPEHCVREWIETEEQEPRGSSVRFEVGYDVEEDGVKVRLFECPSTAIVPARGAAAAAQPPTGPRVHPGVEGAPLAPRADQQRGRGVRAPRITDPNIRSTLVGPMLYWKPLPDELADRRIENMRRFYDPEARISDDDKRHSINRYFFENGDSFVDRGKEIFAGIRPPHREAEHRRMMREQRQHGGGGRLLEPFRRDRNRIPAPQSFRPSGSDRYMGSGSRGDSWSRHEDRRYDGRSERGGGRFRDNRNSRRG